MALAGGSGTIAIADADLDEITTTGTIIVGDAAAAPDHRRLPVSAPGSARLQFGGSSVALDAGVTTTDASITLFRALPSERESPLTRDPGRETLLFEYLGRWSSRGS